MKNALSMDVIKRFLNNFPEQSLPLFSCFEMKSELSIKVMFFAMGADCNCHICLGHDALNNDVAQIQTRSDKKLCLLCAAVQLGLSCSHFNIWREKKNLVWTCLHIVGDLACSHTIATCMQLSMGTRKDRKRKYTATKELYFFCQITECKKLQKFQRWSFTILQVFSLQLLTKVIKRRLVE